jgi:ABC-type sugar transport system substrate-binding protein
MAARALGFAGYGQEKIVDPQFKEEYPVLLTPLADPIEEQEARRQINEAALACYFGSSGQEIDGVASNNDEMALGAYCKRRASATNSARFIKKCSVPEIACVLIAKLLRGRWFAPSALANSDVSPR